MGSSHRKSLQGASEVLGLAAYGYFDAAAE